MNSYILFTGTCIYCLQVYIVYRYMYVLFTGIYCLHVCIVYRYILFTGIYCLQVYIVYRYMYLLFTGKYCLQVYIVYRYILFTGTCMYCLQVYIVYRYILLVCMFHYMIGCLLSNVLMRTLSLEASVLTYTWHPQPFKFREWRLILCHPQWYMTSSL